MIVRRRDKENDLPYIFRSMSFYNLRILPEIAVGCQTLAVFAW